MKNFFLIILLILLPIAVLPQIPDQQAASPAQITQSETNLNIAEPQNVLVVFKRGNSVSEAIKDHYVSVRNIPSVNIVCEGENNLPGLDFSGNTDIELAQNGEVIKRISQCANANSNGYCDYVAWQYYIDEIATPIANYLNNTIDPNTGLYLKDQIRYIVLCKGIPLKIQSGDPYRNWYTINVSVDGLLCLLKNDNNNNPSVLTLYPPTTPPGIIDHYNALVGNPYYSPDYDLTMNYRFKPNHFLTEHGNNGQYLFWKLAYLVSRLDGRNLDDVIQLIVRSVAADHSGEGKWIIDTHKYYSSDFYFPLEPWKADWYASDYNDLDLYRLMWTNNKLNNLDFNVVTDANEIDNTRRNPITTTNGQVMGYLSWGAHAGMQVGYINNLNFSYLPGAVFSSIESFNGYSMDAQFRRDGQGMITEFIQKGGTSGAGQTWEPFSNNVTNPFHSFSAYAMGYGFVDAMYQGYYRVGWQNIVVGDPLTTIAWGKQSLTENKTLTGTNLVTGVITIPSGKTLTIAANAVINFKHNGALVVNGNLTIGHDAVLNFFNGSAIVVNGTLTIENNLTIPSGAALTMKSGSVLNFGNSLTINGTLNIENVITLPAGTILTLNPGASVKCTQYGNLVVNGTLTANGTPASKITFNRSGTTGKWGSIKFNGAGASSSILNNVEVYNSANIQILNDANIIVENSKIQDCTQGIYIYNASPQILNNQILHPLQHGIYVDASGRSPLILDNTITKIPGDANYKNQEGIILYNGTCGYIAHNDVSGFNHGIYIGGGSYVSFTDYDFQQSFPNNRFTDNLFGIKVAWGSWLDGGFDDMNLGGWNNSIYGNANYEIIVYQSSLAFAMYNYWGSDNFYCDGTSDLCIWPYTLPYDPWGSQSAMKLNTTTDYVIPDVQPTNINANSVPKILDMPTSKELAPKVQETKLNQDIGVVKIDNDFLKGIKLRKEGKIDAAIEQLKKVVKDKKYGLYAITELVGIKVRYGRENIQTYFEDLLKDTNTEHKSRIKKALASFYLYKNEDDRAIDLYDEIKNNKSSIRDNFDGLLNKFNYMLHIKKDIVSAKNLLAEIKDKFGDDEEAIMHIVPAEMLISEASNFALGKKQNNSETPLDIEIPKEYALFNNYPNPFNPVTTITYQLPKSGSVTLKIYDMLGKEVKTLVNEQKEMGRYTVQFDASSLASGMYVYQLRVNDYTSTKKMLLLK